MGFIFDQDPLESKVDTAWYLQLIKETYKIMSLRNNRFRRNVSPLMFGYYCNVALWYRFYQIDLEHEWNNFYIYKEECKNMVLIRILHRNSITSSFYYSKIAQLVHVLAEALFTVNFIINTSFC